MVNHKGEKQFKLIEEELYANVKGSYWICICHSSLMASVTEFAASWQSARCCQSKEIRARDPECLDDSLQNYLQILLLDIPSFLF